MTMSETPSKRPRLLFIISNDFGELSSALHFDMGQNFDSLFAIPPRLFAIHGGHLPAPTCQYQTPEDLLAIVNRHHPDAVLLFSGYLFGINGIFNIDVMRRLLMDLRQTGYRLATSDPFLGLLTRLDAMTFSDSHPKKSWLTEHFKQINKLMEGINHLYVTDVQNPANYPSRAFFNEEIIVSPAELAQFPSRLNEWIARHPQKRRWTFVLSAEDYALQTAIHGRAAFDMLLARKMQETAQCGRQPVLVAPTIAIESVAALSGMNASLVLLPFCNYELFRILTLESEYVFYWNIFSHSVLSRVANGLPLFFYDTGHLARAVPPLHSLGLEKYYSNVPLPYAAQEPRLNQQMLADLAAKQKAPLRAAMANLRRLPSAKQVIEEFIAP